MRKFNLKTMATAMRDKLAHTPIENVDAELNPAPLTEEQQIKLAKAVLKLALGTAYEKDPDAALRVMNILKEEKFI